MFSVKVTIDFQGEDVPYSKYIAMVATETPDALMGALMASIAEFRLEGKDLVDASNK